MSPFPHAINADETNIAQLRPRAICALIMYMTTLPVADARTRLSKIVDDAEQTHARYEITRNGRRAAVLLAADDFDALQETIAVLSDQELLTSHLCGVAEISEGDSLDSGELAEVMRVAGRSARA